MAEEHLLVNTMGMMTTEGVVAAMKTHMTHGTVVLGAPEMITLGMIIGMMIDPNPPPIDPTESKTLEYTKGRRFLC